MVPEKYLKRVNLSSDVYAICIQHALTTEKQEIMGLLIGEPENIAKTAPNKYLNRVNLSSNVYMYMYPTCTKTDKQEIMGLLIEEIDEEECVSNISACMILHRSDKQPDRVEISPEQLCGASVYAEQLATDLKRPMRVIGWYHSHPHITVWPSHVDIGTQATYQMLDPLFVGVIFSVYQSDPRLKNNQVQLTCFQSLTQGGSKLERREVPLFIEKSPFQLHNLEGIANLSKVLIQEEVECHSIKDNETNDPIARLHNEAFKTLALVHIVSKVSRPMCDDLVERLNATKLRIKELESIKAELLMKKNK